MKIEVVPLIMFLLIAYGSADEEDLFDFFGFRPNPNITIGRKTTTTPKQEIITTTNQPLANLQTCGRKKLQHIGLITSGTSTEPGDWPWHSAIFKSNKAGNQSSYICGGSLVSRDRIITAGHCVVEYGYKVEANRLTVYLGKYELHADGIGSQKKSVSDCILHSNYNYTYLSNDIAILRLSSNVTFTEYVQPICMWEKNFNIEKHNMYNKNGVIVGWGNTEKDELATKLIMATIPVIDDWDCIATDPAFFSLFLTRYSYCAGYANGTSPCNGDSGGGMYFPKIVDGKTEWYLRGIISLSATRTDKKLCDPNLYAIFTDVAQYLNFIYEYIPEEDIDFRIG